jgi:hypothetical protein
VNHKGLARQLRRRIAMRCRYEPSDGIPRELRALADALYPPIKGGKVVRDFGRNRVARKSQTRKSFQIFVGK